MARQPAPKVIHWLDSIDDHDAYLSVITIGEISKGIERLPDSIRKERLRQWLNNDLLIRFSGRILILDTDVMLVWGQVTSALEARGRKLPVMDSMIAAQALYGQFYLVTRNEDDFRDTGVSIFNPWR
jgi:tRNA(fMet)-specific endonuclease VapC